MSRTTDPGFDPRIADWLEADPNHAPPDVMRTVDAALPSIPQRRVLRLPWRLPPMSSFTKLAVAAVVVLAVGTLGVVALRPGGVATVGSVPSPTASATPSPTPVASGSPAASPPPLSETFASPTNGISIAYPAGWGTKPATEPWTLMGWPSFESSNGDFLYDQALRDHLFIALASQPLGDRTADQWAADTLAADDCPPRSEPITIDGASGLVGHGCDIAAVAAGDRGYVIVLYTSSDDPSIVDGYDQAWFDQLLATVDLRPEDAASASPSP